MTASQCDSSVACSQPSPREIPALLTATSMRPWRSTIASYAASTSAAEVTSSSRVSTVPTSEARRASVSALRSSAVTWAPRRANASTAARPMPEAPPVTTTTLSCSPRSIAPPRPVGIETTYGKCYMTIERTIASELLEASDELIERAVAHADPMVLRGLLYQLTGDEEAAATRITVDPAGFQTFMMVAEEADVAMLRRKTVDFLTAHRDAGAAPLDIGPEERLRRSVPLVLGEELDDAEFEYCREELALDPWARTLTWREPPAPERLRDFSVTVIGAGFGGLNAAVMLKRAGIPYTVIEKDSGVGGTWWETRYPGARVDTPEPRLHARLRRALPLLEPVLRLGREPALLRLGRRHLRAARGHRLRHRGALAHLGRGGGGVGGRDRRAGRPAHPALERRRHRGRLPQPPEDPRDRGHGRLPRPLVAHVALARGRRRGRQARGRRSAPGAPATSSSRSSRAAPSTSSPSSARRSGCSACRATCRRSPRR